MQSCQDGVDERHQRRDDGSMFDRQVDRPPHEAADEGEPPGPKQNVRVRGTLSPGNYLWETLYNVGEFYN